MHFDVLIAGAGPAGTASAILLARAGVKTAIVDPGEFPEFKPGESLPGAVGRLLNRLQLPPLPQCLQPDAFRPCTANVSAWGEDRWTFQDGILNPEGGGWHVNRREFDAFLGQKAAELNTEWIKGRIAEVQKNAGQPFSISVKWGENLTKTITASRLIDASGRAMAIGRRLGVRRIRLSDQMAVVGWFYALHDVDFATRIKSVPNGWWYTALLPGNIRVAVFHGQAEAVNFMAKNPDSFKKEVVQVLGFEPGDYAAGLKTCDAGMAFAEKSAAPQWLAVGDAALSFDPLAAQGIFFALYSGIQAAEVMLGEKTPAEYEQSVLQIKKYTQQQRQFFYTLERRYAHLPYWRAATAFAALD